LNQYIIENHEKSHHQELNNIRSDEIVKENPEGPTREKPKRPPTGELDKPLPPPLPKKEKSSKSLRPQSQPQRRCSPYKKLKEYLRNFFQHTKKLRFTKTTEQLRDELILQQYKSTKFKKNK
jgi:hypothetical protein